MPRPRGTLHRYQNAIPAAALLPAGQERTVPWPHSTYQFAGWSLYPLTTASPSAWRISRIDAVVWSEARLLTARRAMPGKYRKECAMKTYIIRRRNAWATPKLLERAAARSRRIGDEEMSDRVRWIRSYVVQEEDGTLGTVCVYQAMDVNAIRDHANRVGMPADEIVEAADTVIVRPDPQPAMTA
jgi:hypothetical protein